MKRIYQYIMIAAAWMMAACDPVVDDKSMGGILSENELNISVTNEGGGNLIKLVNNTRGVGSYWDYGINNSTLSSFEVVYPFMGTFTVEFTALCDGGTVTTTRSVEVTKITTPIDKEWTLFAGSGVDGKKWTWNDEADWCYGTGSYGWEVSPDWDSWAVGDTPDTGEISMNDYIKFDLDGGANFTSFIDGEEVKGTFVFDMSKAIEGYRIGVLELSKASVLLPVDGYEGEDAGIIRKFDIIELSDDNLILASALPGNIFQDENWESYATYWNFKAK